MVSSVRPYPGDVTITVNKLLMREVNLSLKLLCKGVDACTRELSTQSGLIEPASLYAAQLGIHLKIPFTKLAEMYPLVEPQ